MVEVNACFTVQIYYFVSMSIIKMKLIVCQMDR